MEASKDLNPIEQLLLYDTVGPGILGSTAVKIAI